MKRTLLLLLLAGAVAAEEVPPSPRLTKAKVGLANVATGWLELPKEVARTYNQANLPFAITGGVIKGVVHALGRTGAGLWDLVTAPIPSEPIPTPRYLWDAWGQETRYGPVFAPPGSGQRVVVDFIEKPRAP